MHSLTPVRHLVPFTILAAASAQGFGCDFQPTVRELVLNTDFTQVVTSCGPVNIAGGVFVFRSVRIPAGVMVRGTGSQRLVLVAMNDIVIDGELTVSGGDGARVDTLNSANFPTPGGVGACTGGNGGRGSPSAVGTDFVGEAGFRLGSVGGGGAGGFISCLTGTDTGRGSGGGGGSFATSGDPFYKNLNVGNSLVQQRGVGGLGGLTRTLAGGAAGPVVLFDPFADNDFHGAGVDLNRRRVVVGELQNLVGGTGGGGGGDRSPQCINNPAWINDAKGGGGGAGGGAVVLIAGGRIVINGHVTANGGNGGGGEQAGSSNQGGGGGGGSGGTIALYSYGGVELRAHGETYANNDYDFVLSADGGIGLQGLFTGAPINGKYPPAPTRNFDFAGAGGFGGLGVIQIATPVDGRNADGTNTIFDDNVHVVLGGQRLTGAAKQRYLAWRGYLDTNGVAVDDSGVPTAIGANEGDMRPSPSLLPLFR